MFFSSLLFTKRGSLAKVWLAAHHQDKRLSKTVVLTTNIEGGARMPPEDATLIRLL